MDSPKESPTLADSRRHLSSAVLGGELAVELASLDRPSPGIAIGSWARRVSDDLDRWWRTELPGRLASADSSVL